MTLTFKTEAYGPETAFLFPGQGAQAVGMGKELYDTSRAARDVFDQIDDALGRSLTGIMFEGPEDDLKETINAQPGIMAVSLACVKAMEEELDAEEMPRPIVMAGHSLGEYTALAVGGALSLEDAAAAGPRARTADAGSLRPEPRHDGGDNRAEPSGAARSGARNRRMDFQRQHRRADSH